jgi:hypothetical protein
VTDVQMPIHVAFGSLIQLRCRDCGYGVSVRSEPEVCPMCRGAAWERLGRGPDDEALADDYGATPPAAA